MPLTKWQNVSSPLDKLVFLRHIDFFVFLQRIVFCIHFYFRRETEEGLSQYFLRSSYDHINNERAKDFVKIFRISTVMILYRQKTVRTVS